MTGETWAGLVEMRRAGAELVDATHEQIAEKAAELGVDDRRLLAFVREARRRSTSSRC